MTATEQEAPAESPPTVGIKNLTVKVLAHCCTRTDNETLQDGTEAIDSVKEFVATIGADSVEVVGAEVHNSVISLP